MSLLEPYYPTGHQTPLENHHPLIEGGGFGGHQTGGEVEQEREEATKDLQNFKQKRLFNPIFFLHLLQITCFIIGYVLT